MPAGLATVGYNDPTSVTIKSVVIYVDASGNLNEFSVGGFLVGTTPTAISASTPLPVNFTNTTLAVTGTFYQATQPISATALPLPTGAATSANQTTQLTSLSSIDGKTPSLGQALAAASVPVILPSATITTLTPPAAITNFANETGGNLATIAGKDFATQTTLAALNTKITVCNTGAVVITSSALPSGASTAAKQPAPGTAGAASVDVLSVQGIASMTALKVDGSAVTQPALLTASATVGGWTPYSLISAATTNATNVKASAGKINGYAIFNTTASAVFVKIYDSGSAPTAGAGTPVRRLMIPANGGVERSFGEQGLIFANGIGFTITGASPDADTTAVTLGAVILNIDYK